MPAETTYYPAIVLLLVLAAASWTDIARHRIPNLLSLGGAFLGLALQAGTLGLGGLWDGLGGLGVGLGLFLPFYIIGGMGAGDVKLMAAAGSFLRPYDTLMAVAASLIAGGVIALVVLIARGGLLPWLRRQALTLKYLLVTAKLSYITPVQDEPAATRFPYAIAIAVGTVTALWWLGRLEPFTTLIRNF
ncbi:MAG: A24 family peptidase [Burkholderiales bacterium]